MVSLHRLGLHTRDCTVSLHRMGLHTRDCTVSLHRMGVAHKRLYGEPTYVCSLGL